MIILTASLLTLIIFTASFTAPIESTFLGEFQRALYVFIATALSLLLWIVAAVLK